MLARLFVALGIGMLSFVISYSGVDVVRRWALRRGVIDIPNKRSSHERPTPRGGGIAMVASFLMCMVLASVLYRFSRPAHWGMLVCGLAVALLGFWDDLRGLSKLQRFMSWISIAIVAMALGIRLQTIELPLIGSVSLGAVGSVATLVWLIGVTNFYNFMDGIDGLAAVEAVTVAGFLIPIAIGAGDLFVALASVALVGAGLGFLIHNWPPASVFMGDGGSNFLGFVFAALAVVGSQDGSIAFLLPVVLLGAFLFDAGVTLLRRLPRGKHWLEPHRDHYYQRLIILGFSHMQVTCLYCCISVLLGCLALLYRRSTGWAAVGCLAGGLMVLSMIPVATNTLESRRGSISTRVQR